MTWIEQNWEIAALVALLVVVALWLLLRSGSSRSTDASTGDAVEQDIPPIITGAASMPVDIPPPPMPVTPEPEALVEPIQAAPTGPPDELTRMKGVGPKVASLLNSLGVTRYDQIAAWSDADVARVDAQLGAFKGRVTRDQWVEQARLLAGGDTSGYEAKFGKLG